MAVSLVFAWLIFGVFASKI